MTDRINSAIIYLPDFTPQNHEDNRAIFAILQQLRNVKQSEDLKYLTGSSANLLPSIAFKKAACASPKISFETSKPMPGREWHANELAFGFNLKVSNEDKGGYKTAPPKYLRDAAGKYLEVLKDGKKHHLLSPQQLLERLDGKLKELNHSGFNTGPNLISVLEHARFKNEVARLSNLYNYPTGDEWPFIIPATEAEFESDIHDTSLNRNPKFEIAYEDSVSFPLVQLDIETTLTKTELLKVLPEPYGISFEGLEDYFRSVFLFVDWGNVLFRVDIRYSGQGRDFGYWLVEEGGRTKFNALGPDTA